MSFEPRDDLRHLLIEVDYLAGPATKRRNSPNASGVPSRSLQFRIAVMSTR